MSMDIEVGNLKVGTEDVDRANKSLNALDRELTKAEKSILKAETAMKILRGELIEVNNRNISLGQGFTKAQSTMLAAMKVAGATTTELKAMAKVVADLNKISKVNPFDGAADPLAKIRKMREETEKGLRLAQKYGDLTKTQLEEVGRGYAFAQQKAVGLFGAERKGFGQRQAFVKQYVSQLVEEFRTQNEANRVAEERNRVAKEAIAIQKQQEATIERQKQLTAQHEANLQAQAKRREQAIAKEVEAWRKAEAEKAKLRQAEATQMNQVIHLHRKREEAIDREIRKLREQAAAMRAGQSTVTGNVVTRLTSLGASGSQIEQARALRREIEELGRAAKRSQDPLYGLQGVMRGLIPAIGALSGGALLATAGRKFVEIADSIQMLSNRIRILSNETVEFEPAFENLKRIADDARAPIMELGTLYARLLPVMGSVGKDAEYAAEVTEAFALAMTISGTTAQEARSGLLQFSQAMSSATFNGDEFRAISEAVPEVLRVLETQLGITRAELRKMSADGKLTSDIVGEALVNSLDELKRRVAAAPKTISQSSTLMRNEFIVLTKNINDTFNITKNIAEFVQNISKAMKAVNDNREAFMGLASASLTVAGILGGSLLVAIGGVAAKVIGASLAVMTLAENMGASKGVTAALGVAAGLLTLALIKYTTASLSAGAGTLKFVASLFTLKGAAAAAAIAVRGVTAAMMANPLFAIATVGVGIIATIAGLRSYNEVIERTTKSLNDQVTAIRRLQTEESRLINLRNQSVTGRGKLNNQIEENRRQIELQTNALKEQLAQRERLLELTNSAPRVRQLTQEIDALRNALNNLYMQTTQRDGMMNASRATRRAVVDLKEARELLESLQLRSQGLDPDRIRRYNEQLNNLNRILADARRGNLEIPQEWIEAEMRRLKVEAGLIDDKTRATKGLTDAQREAQQLQEFIENSLARVTEQYIRQTGALESVTEEQLILRDLQMNPIWDRVPARIREEIVERLKLSEVIGQNRKATEFFEASLRRVTDLFIEQTGALDNLSQSQRLLRDLQMNPYWDTLNEQQRQELRNIIDLTDAEERRKQLRSQQDQINQGLTQEIEAIQQRISEIGKTEEQIRSLNRVRELETINALELQYVERKARGEAVDGIRQEIANRRKRLELQDQEIERLKEYQEQLTRQESFDRLRDTVADVIATGFFEGGEKGAEKLKDVLRNAFRNFVINVLINPIANNMTGGLMQAGSSVMSALTGGGAGGTMNIMTMTNNIYKSIASGLNAATGAGQGVANLMATTVSRFGASTFTNMTTQFASGMMSTGSSAAFSQAFEAGGSQLAGVIVGSILNGFSGYNISQALSGGYSAGSWVNTVAGIASMIPGIGPIAGAVGGLFNRAFGRKPAQTTGTGISGTFSTTGANVQQYQEWHQKGGWFRSSKSGVNYSAVSQEMDNFLDAALVQITATTKAYAEVLGLNANAIDGVTQSIKISLMGLDAEQQQQAIVNALTGFGDRLAQELLGTFVTTTRQKGRIFRRTITETTWIAGPFVRAGETAGEALQRLATSLMTVNQVFDTLNVALMQTSLVGADASSQLIDLFGGTEQFVQATSKYYELFYSEQERAETAFRQLTQTFATLGLSLPATHSEFRALVEAQDLYTESGRAMYAALITLAPVFDQVTKAMDNVFAETMQGLMRLFDFLGDQIDALRRTSTAVVSAQGADARSVIRGAISSGFSDPAIITDAVERAVRSVQETQFASSVDQERARLVLANELEILQAQTGFQLSVDESILREVRTLVGGVDNVYQAILILSQSISDLGFVATGNQINISGIPTIPTRAKGGYTPAGLTLVGEEGPELVNFESPSMIYTAAQTRNLMSSGGNSEAMADAIMALNENISMLRAEVRADVQHNAKTARILDRAVQEGDALLVRVQS